MLVMHVAVLCSADQCTFSNKLEEVKSSRLHANDDLDWVLPLSSSTVRGKRGKKKKNRSTALAFLHIFLVLALHEY